MLHAVIDKIGVQRRKYLEGSIAKSQAPRRCYYYTTNYISPNKSASNKQEQQWQDFQ